MDKLGRNYVLQIQLAENAPLTSFTLPLTIEFDITRNTLTSANVCQIRIYNLSLKNRNQIRFNISDYGTFRQVILNAGYGANPPRVFAGNISQAWSVREGTNFITQIECYDGGFAFANGNVTTGSVPIGDLPANATALPPFPAGSTRKDGLKSIASTLPHVDVGTIGNGTDDYYLGTLPRQNSYTGNSMNILGELTGGGAFVDDQKLNALGTDEYIINNAAITEVSSSTGLLETPVLEQYIVRFNMLFEPRLLPGTAVNLRSITESNFNGLYKVTGVKHRGMISPAVCGSAITTGEFFFSKKLIGIPQGSK